MTNKPHSCAGCSLETTGKGFTRVEGKGVIPLLICGEASGETEASASLPFRPHAPAGSVLERALRRAGFDRQQFAVSNLLNCQPPHNKLDGAVYEQSAVSHCLKHHFSQTLLNYKPKAILACGNVPLRHLTGMAGEKRSIAYLRGYVLPSQVEGAPPVVPTYHPSFIARGASNLIGVLIHDLKKAVSLAKGELKEGTDYILRPDPSAMSYNTNATSDDLRALLDRLRREPSLEVSFDIETSWSSEEDEDGLTADPHQVTQIQFSVEPGTGMAAPWDPELLPLVREVLLTPNPKVTFNGYRFDLPVLKAAGFDVAGEVFDAMCQHHYLQPDLPANLQFAASLVGFQFPWKHMAGSDLAFYGVADVDATLRVHRATRDSLSRQGMWHLVKEGRPVGGYYYHVHQLRPVLDRMCGRGIPFDEAGKDGLRGQLEGKLEEIRGELREAVPDPCLAPERKGAPYKTLPPALKRAWLADLDADRHVIGENVYLRRDGLWYKYKQFNPASSQQLLSYMRHRRHQVPTAVAVSPEGEKVQRETTIDRELSRLHKRYKDPVYQLVQDYREVQKISSTYVEGWKADERGRVHSTFTFQPASGQLSARSPNCQNVPNAGVGAEFRKLVRAEPGHVLIEADLVGAHALMVGFEARDPDYMRLTRYGVHDFLVAQMLRLPERDKLLSLPDDELGERLKWIKKTYPVERKAAKAACHGANFLVGPRKLFDLNREIFSNEREARALLDLLRSLFPAIPRWQDEVMDLAHRQGFLKSRHGHVRRFWEVKRWDPSSRLWVRGGDAEDCVAFLPSNDCHGRMRSAMLALAERGFDALYQLINMIHDSLLFHCPEGLVADCVRDVRAVMEAPSPVLVDPEVAPLGLVCPIELKWGPSWGEMEDLKL